MHATWTFLAIVAAIAVVLLATCSATPELVFLDLIELHGPDGQVVYVNPAEISSLRQPNHTDLGRYFPKGTHCVVVTTNAKFIASRESCSDIRDRLTPHDPP